MANTTFKGPVRSQNGFEIIKESATTGALTTDMGLKVHQYSLTVGAADATAAITDTLPANFIVLSVLVAVTSAATNAVTLQNLGPVGATDTWLDGIGAAVNSTGFKGVFVGNGGNGIVSLGGGTTAAATAPATLTVTLSGAPGAGGCTILFKVLGIDSTSDTA
jgi:hypothetical protein